QKFSSEFFDDFYEVYESELVKVESHPSEIDEGDGGPYAIYNWELFFHVPLTIAVHLSKTQRFAEAQRWFHFVFDPTATDTGVEAPDRFWKFLRFRQPGGYRIEELMQLLSTPDGELDEAKRQLKEQVLAGYEAIRKNPFRPHAVARTRPLAYQYQVVMKYLDNLIAWGDNLFAQDTVETINEATQRYVLAANLLGPRPQKVPSRGEATPKTFAQLRERGLDPTGNAMVELENQFPFAGSPQSASGEGEAATALFGIGRALYFCVPGNERLLSYWDTVGDRLYKIRHCMDIRGAVRQLALYDPPIDPGMLVKAAAAGIDVGSIVAGTNQPIGPTRSLPLIHKAAELAAEVRNLGSALLGAIEKEEAEKLALLRQSHEVKVQELAKGVRFLQWKNAEAATEALMRARTSAWERYRYNLRLQGIELDGSAAPEWLALDRRELTEENFDEAMKDLVLQFDREIKPQQFSALPLAGTSSPASEAAAEGPGGLHLTRHEEVELNDFLPAARDMREAASVADTAAGVLTFFPDFNLNIHFWGIGGSSKVAGGFKLSDASKIGAEVLRTLAARKGEQAALASRTAQQERRADDWVLQANAGARELAHYGKQIIASLIAEQVAHREYENVKAQIANSAEVETVLSTKFTKAELHGWMQGELSRLYYQWYRFALDTARRAERTMKYELRRPELEATDFVQPNHWDGGYKGLLAGEALQLDVKRMEMAYHENNRREFELTRHVSLRQLDPLALLRLKTAGACTVTIPEWLFDRDYPGHYMRRIKQVSVSVPGVTGPYTPVACTLSLQHSSIRTVPTAADYPRGGPEDSRFVDSYGPVEQIVTSAGANDSGMFEPTLQGERFLPFEGAGAISTWQIELPRELRGFDYASIADLVVHLRYTSLPAGGELGEAATKALKEAAEQVGKSGLALLFSLRHDFPTEWAAFAAGSGPFKLGLEKGHFPYFVQGAEIAVGALELYAGERKLKRVSIDPPNQLSADLNGDAGKATIELPPDGAVLKRDAPDVFLVLPYGFDLG
ncbi:MAG TPA: hypothetical protein VN732_06420, partial [Solirubrobacterales bacterium]|nr:hypothetical protein [Solirubrobacterales bacterium]